MVRLFSATTEFGDKRGEGQTNITWLAFREKPVAPYESLISNYGRGNYGTKEQEKAVNQLFTWDELGELHNYLTRTRGWELKYREATIPKDFHFAFKIWAPLTPIKLFEEPDYNLSVAVAGGAHIIILPGLQLSEYSEAALSLTYGNIFFEKVFKKLGIEMTENQGIFSFQNLQRVYLDVFYESGLYVHSFGQRDELAEITPDKHLEYIAKYKAHKSQVEEWSKNQQLALQNDADDLDSDTDIEDW